MTTTHSIERYLHPRGGRDELLTPAEVAEWIHVKVGTLAAWRTERPRRGPKHQPIGKRIFYRASDVQAWLDEQRDAATA